MKTKHWLRRFGASLLGSAMVLNAMPVQTLMPISAEEAKADDNQMVSTPEVVTVDMISSAERTINFNENWKFSLSDPAGAQTGSFDDSKWERVNLPHDYSINQEYTAAGEAESGYKLGGVGWYRKAFTISPEMKNKRVVVEFNGVYMDCAVYLNGEKLGEHPYGYTGFAFDLTDHLNTEGENILSVRVNHQTPSSRWYSGSGIYRDVNLTVTDQVHVAYNGVTVTTPNVKTEAATGTVTTRTGVTVDNDGDASKEVTVKQTVLDQKGNAIGSGTKTVTIAAGATEQVNLDVAASNPKLWSTTAANLYDLKTEIMEGDKVVDTVTTTFGYRWYEFDTNTGFSLNGEKLKLKGVCMHHDQGALGSAAEDRAMERQIQMLKEMGCNTIRVTHNPADPDFLKICSREGILVINELFDGWVGAKNGNSKDYARFFNVEISEDNEILNKKDGETWSIFDARATVQESRNEASVMMYSLCNEVFEGAYVFDNSAQIAQSLIDEIRRNDSERLVTFGGNQLKKNNSENGIADTITSNDGVVGANYANASDYASLHRNHPTWKLVGSETASHVNSRGVYTTQASQGLTSDKLLTSYDTSAVGWGATASSAWYDVITQDFVAGEYVWTGFDYIGEPTPNNGVGTNWVNGTNSPKNSFFGIIDTAGLPKDNFYFYRSQWNQNDTTLHVLPAWNRDVVMNNGNGNVPVVVYSNAASVELFITPTGGSRQSLGKKTFTEKTTGAGYKYQIYEGTGADSTAHKNLSLTWNVPYQDGKLEAVAYDKSGKVISTTVGRSSVETTGAASKLDLTADRSEINGDGTDLSYITIDVTDAQGRIVPSAKNAVTVQVEGAGELAGMDNGVQPDHQLYSDNNRKAQAGQLIAIVRSNGQDGPITVTATADGLESKTITLNAKAVEGDEKAGPVSFKYSRNYYVKTGNKPTLPLTVEATYEDGSTKDVPVVWPEITDEMVATAGSFSLNGVADGVPISVAVNVLDEISTLLNVSQVVAKGTVPTLPAARQPVLNNGTVLNTNFDVEWDMPEASAFAEPGNVEINGKAQVFGKDVPVKAFIRVADATVSLGASVTGDAYLSQNIPDDKQSDTLNAIKDGVIEFDPANKTGENNNTCWSNYNYSYETPENKTAQITFRYDTQTIVGQINVYFTNDTWSASYPDANTTSFEVSENGVEWTPVEVTETISEDTVNAYTKKYTYSMTPTAFTFLRMTVTNANGLKPNNNHNKCTGIAEVELLKAETNITVNSAAELSSLSINGADISASMLANKVITTSLTEGELSFAAKDNGAVTVLPKENNTQVIVVESEDGETQTKYTIRYGVTSPDDSTRDILRDKLTATAGSYQPGEGPERALDNNSSTLWHGKWEETDASKLWIEFDIDGDYLVDGLRYQPRQNGNYNGNITGYKIQYQDASGNWVDAAEGTWASDHDWKLATFDPVATKKVRLTATSTEGDTSYKLVSAAEIRLTGTVNDNPAPALDYSVLNAAINKADNLKLADFADGEAKTALSTALSAAKALNGKANVQTQIDNAALALGDALLDLRLLPNSAKLNEIDE